MNDYETSTLKILFNTIFLCIHAACEKERKVKEKKENFPVVVCV
jgi:hypothetical protein